MHGKQVYGALIIMILTIYLIRVTPLLVFRKEIKNRWIRSFLYYVPYVTLSAMTVPAIFYATRSVYSAAAGFIVALILAFMRKGLLTVAAGACIAVFIAERFLI